MLLAFFHSLSAIDKGVSLAKSSNSYILLGYYNIHYMISQMYFVVHYFSSLCSGVA